MSSNHFVNSILQREQFVTGKFVKVKKIYYGITHGEMNDKKLKID